MAADNKKQETEQQPPLVAAPVAAPANAADPLIVDEKSNEAELQTEADEPQHSKDKIKRINKRLGVGTFADNPCLYGASWSVRRNEKASIYVPVLLLRYAVIPARRSAKPLFVSSIQNSCYATNCFTKHDVAI
jgi:hypothetical protein